MRVLVDPWVAAIGDDDDDQRFAALRTIGLILRQERPDWPTPSVVGFLSLDDLEAIFEAVRRRRGRGFELLHVLFGDPHGPVVELEAGCPGTPETWRRALGGEGDGWRDPVVGIPEDRLGSWPTGPDVRFRQDATHPWKSRRKAALQTFVHPTPFEPLVARDYDPWLYVEPDHAQTAGKHPCCLPRPPQLYGVPMQEWRGVLSDIPARQTRDGVSYLYFIPPNDWRSEALGQQEWRDRRVFGWGRKSTRKGVKQGSEDREGRVWVWDDKVHHHWDVQVSDATSNDYADVSHTGRILHDFHPPK